MWWHSPLSLSISESIKYFYLYHHLPFLECSSTPPPLILSRSRDVTQSFALLLSFGTDLFANQSEISIDYLPTWAKMYFKSLVQARQVNSSIASRPLAVTRSVYSETSIAYRPSSYRLFKEFCGSRKVTHFNRVSIYLWWDSFPSHFTVMVYFFLVMFYPYLWSVLNQS